MKQRHRPNHGERAGNVGQGLMLKSFFQRNASFLVGMISSWS